MYCKSYYKALTNINLWTESIKQNKKVKKSNRGKFSKHSLKKSLQNHKENIQ